MKKLLKLIPLFIFIFITSLCFTQHTVAIIPSETEVCAPASITLNSNVTNCTGTITDYYWQDGAGNDFYNENVVFAYTAGGTYTVSLTVTCDGVSVTETIEIEVYESPVAAIDETPINACVGQDVMFMDASTSGDAPIDTWMWYFGDGSSSGLQNPTHVYDVSWHYDVSLVVTDINGCSSEHIENEFVSISVPPEVSFVGDETEYCTVPHGVGFESEISTSFNIGYTVEWDFGDGSSTSSYTNPTHTYNADGVYNVSLTVVDDNGCATTETYFDYIQIASPIAQYSVSNEGVACVENSIFFTNETGYSCSWDFGDGTLVNNVSTPTHIYNNSGDYTVEFTIDPGGMCEASTTFNILVEEVVASFTTAPTNLNACSELTVSFNSLVSPNVTEYYWYFGDGETSNEANPTHVYGSPGNFEPFLVVGTENACILSYIGSNSVNIYAPDATFVGDNVQGCAPITVNFTHTGINSLSNIVSYSWNFGNGQIITDGEANEFVTFDAGEYTVNLTVTDENGCEGNYSLDVSVGSNLDFTYDVFQIDHSPLFDDNICAQDTLVLWLQEWDLSGAEFTWMIDTLYTVPVLQEYTEYVFNQDTGWTHLNLILSNNGCIDTVYWDGLYVNGPIINELSYYTDCSSPLDFTFNLDQTAADAWDWEFFYYSGDLPVIIEQDYGSTSEMYPISFPSQQTYWCKVSAYNASEGCMYVDSIEISISAPQAFLTLTDTDVCSNEQVILNGGLSQNVSEYYWDFGDGENSGWLTESEAQYVWTGAGNHTITLIVKDANGCENSITDEINILGPDISITVDNTSACDQLTANFTANVLASEPVTTIVWNFMSGEQLYGSNVEYTYNEPGTYTVGVFAATESDCYDYIEYEDLINIGSADAMFSVSDVSSCVGEEVIFEAEVIDTTDIYTWNFGDGVEVVGNNPIISHVFSSGGYFDISLEVVDNAGCSDQLSLDSYVYIQEPHANFSFEEDVFSCYPVQASVIQNSTVDPPDSELTYSWRVRKENLGFVNIQNLFFDMPGDFTVRMIASTTNGCRDTCYQPFTVGGPYAAIFIDTVCFGEEAFFELSYLQDVESYQWNLGDGTISSELSFTHVYEELPSIGYYPVTLYLSSADCDVVFHEEVLIHDLPGDVFVSGGGVFDGEPVTLTATGGEGGCILWQGTDSLGTSLSEYETQYEVSEPGVYYFRAVNGLGCWGNPGSAIVGSTGDLEVQITLIPASAPGVADGEAIVAVTGGVEPYDISCTQAKTEFPLNELLAGTYLLQVTDAEDHTYSETFTLAWSGIENEENETFTLFPNPTNGLIKLCCEKEIPENITVLNQIGETILKLNPESRECMLNLDDYSSGIYYIEIKFLESIITKKLVLY